MASHAKVDPETGELMFFHFALLPPFMTYNVVSANGQLAHTIPIDLPGPRLAHDMAITEHYSILMDVDLPLISDPTLLVQGADQASHYPQRPMRFAVVPRYRDIESVRWFEATPGYVYPTSKAWEEGDEIIMDGCKGIDPKLKLRPHDGDLARLLALLRVETRLWRWRLNLKTGNLTEEQIDDATAEFPSFNRQRLGRQSRHAYAVSVPHESTLLFDGLITYDVEKGKSERYRFGAEWYGNEAPFAPRLNARTEDDGYVITFVTNANTGAAEVQIIDAQHFAAGPVARVQLPQRVPMAFHALWVPGTK